ncbi:MAG: hypothetical protein IT168_13925 [Bryobacterales bacterium]|nr:hypothetical protein [Bryobacterales bacterium]
MDGLGAPGTDENGKPYDFAGYNGTVGFGAYASYSRPRDSFQFSYGSGFTVFSKNANYYSGMNHNLSLSYSRLLTNRWSMFASVGAHITNTVLGANRLGTQITAGYFNDPFQPMNEIFDNRMYGFSAGLGASYRATGRWTLSMMGTSGTVIRRSQALVSYVAFATGGEASYALNRVSSAGVSYSFSKFDHRRGFGDAASMSWMGLYSRQLSRQWRFGGGAGLYRAELNRLQTFQIDPFIAALIGQTTSIQRFYAKRYGLSAAANLGATFRKSNVNINYNRGVNPGNGVLLTAEAETAGVSYGYTGFRRLGLFSNAGWGRMKALLETTSQIRNFESLFASGGASYQIAPFLHFNAGITAHHAKIGGPNYLRNRWSAQIGISLSPGEVPLVLW